MKRRSQVREGTRGELLVSALCGAWVSRRLEILLVGLVHLDTIASTSMFSRVSAPVFCPASFFLLIFSWFCYWFSITWFFIRNSEQTIKLKFWIKQNSKSEWNLKYEQIWNMNKIEISKIPNLNKIRSLIRFEQNLKYEQTQKKLKKIFRIRST
jgi:hypothetical protein